MKTFRNDLQSNHVGEGLCSHTLCVWKCNPVLLDRNSCSRRYIVKSNMCFFLDYIESCMLLGQTEKQMVSSVSWLAPRNGYGFKFQRCPRVMLNIVSSWFPCRRKFLKILQTFLIFYLWISVFFFFKHFQSLQGEIPRARREKLWC